jgi:hypothetical protein
MKEKILALTLWILTININAQGNLIEDFNLSKKVNVSNNYNTGKVGISIPLYNIDLGDLKLESALSYTQEIPKGEPSWVGTNWDYNPFGKIIIAYRDPSKFLAPFTILNGAPNGYNLPQNIVGMPPVDYCVLTPDADLVASKFAIMNNPPSIIKSSKPNKFYFDFFGYNGYMIYDNTGKLIVNSDKGNLKAEFIGNKCYNLYNPINNIPKIIIKDDLGNQFYFGGDFDTADIYYGEMRFDNNWYHSTNSNYYTMAHTNYLSALYLKKVILANGRVIEGFYKQGNRSTLDPYINGGVYMKQDYPYNLPSKATLLANNIFMGVDQAEQFDTATMSADMYNVVNEKVTKVTIFQKTSVLDSIKISDYGSIKFDYLQRTNELTKPFLSTLKIKSAKKEVKSISFNYATLNNSTFLQSLINNQDEYKFDYYSDFANTVSSYPKGLIKNLIYPTKGSESFEFEPNKVSKRLLYSSNDTRSSETWADNLDLIVDGFRVKKITKTSFLDNYTTNFSYLDDNGKESGIFSYYSSFAEGGTTFSPNNITSWVTSKYQGYFDDYVKYSAVTEDIVGKEKSKYYFTDLITNPDSIAAKGVQVPNPGSTVPIQKLTLRVNKSDERGKLYKVEKYNSNNELVFKEETKYTNFLDNANPIKEISPTCLDCKITDDRYYVATENGYDFWQYQPIQPYLPKSVKTWTKLGGDVIENKRYLKYNTSYQYWHSLPIEEKSESLGKTKIVSTYYPGDIIRNQSTCISGNCPTDTDLVGEKFSMYKDMANKGTNYPVLQLLTNNFGKTSLTENIYKKNSTSGNLIKLDKTRASLLGSNFSANSYNQAQVYNKEHFELYDSFGNLLQSKSENGITITTIWGYKQTYPIAKIVGASYNQVVSAFGLDGNNLNSYLELDIVKKSNSDIDESSEQSLATSLKNFKNTLIDYHVTTTTYDPLVGNKIGNSPSGVIESNRYDIFGRLEKVIDADNHIIKEYSYNYAPMRFYNEKYTKVFYKNNCPSWMVGQPYTYTVPANTYISFISPEDANLMAQNNASANGQAEANTNGSCGFISCGFTPNYYVNPGFTSIQQTGPNHIKIIMTFSANPPSGMSWANSGISVGYIGADCKPLSNKSIASGTYMVNIDTSGYVTISSSNFSGPPAGSPVGFSVEYDK